MRTYRVLYGISLYQYGIAFTRPSAVDDTGLLASSTTGLRIIWIRLSTFR